MSGIYVHIPFCNSKCIYCAFYSIVNQRDKQRYVESIVKEISGKGCSSSKEEIDTLYFGGGTPSVLEISDIQVIIDAIRTNFNIDNLSEFTFEANPEQISEQYCAGLKQLGINRLSIGVQSFNNEILRFLGRKHTAEEAVSAVNNAYNAGFQNISVDLIYGINERSDSMWKSELEMLKSLPIKHFSAYALTLEENSILYKKVRNHQHEQLDEEMAERQYYYLIDFLKTSDFQQYEVSNFAFPDFHSKHNSSYWYGIPYYGFGVSAHSYDGSCRCWNAPTLKEYFIQIAEENKYQEKEILTGEDKFNEFVLLRLRTSRGIKFSEVLSLFGKEKVEYLQNYFEKEVKSEYYVQHSDGISLTAAGLWHADGIASNAFLVD